MNLMLDGCVSSVMMLRLGNNLRGRGDTEKKEMELLETCDGLCTVTYSTAAAAVMDAFNSKA